MGTKREIKPIPSKLRVCDGVDIPVNIKSIRSLGLWSERDATITINPKSAEYERWIILIHELLHAIETQLIQGGIISRRVGEPFVQHASCLLVGILAQNDLFTPIPSDVARRWVRKVVKQQLEMAESEGE